MEAGWPLTAGVVGDMWWRESGGAAPGERPAGGGPEPLRTWRRADTLWAAVAYGVLAVVMTWPLALGIHRDLPSDVGDPVFNSWTLGRNAAWLLDPAAWKRGSFWDARIFYPEPLTLAYSEHLIAQTLQVLPVYAVTGNAILCHNLLFLSSFALSALGGFLLVRELTGSARGGFVAGLCYGFSLYRLDQLSHVQTLSSHWMPFALLYLHRFCVSGRRGPLAAAAAFLCLQGLSCGYWLAFFTPFWLAYSLHRALGDGALGQPHALRRLGLALGLVGAVSLPFLVPYAELRSSGQLQRPVWEIESMSADLSSYLTAPPEARLWGGVLDALPRLEGRLFPGLVPLALALAACLSEWRSRPSRTLTAGRLVLAAAAAFTVCGSAALLLHAAAVQLDLVRPGLEGGALLVSAAAAAIALASARVRRRLVAVSTTPFGFFALGGLLAVWLSFGPSVKSFGTVLAPGPYLALYEWIPGFDGLRVPARFAMLATLCLACVAGYGASALCARPRGAWCAWGLSLLLLLEASGVPVPLNREWADYAYRPLPQRLEPAPEIYERVAELPAEAVLVELPFGSEPREVRYMYYSLSHGRRLVNGFSGAFPASYARNRAALSRVLVEPDRAWRAMAGSGATHALVHEDAWGIPRKGRRVSRWLEERGSRLLAAVGRARLYALPARPPDAR